MASRAAAPRSLLVTAHRGGAALAPENTLAALQGAIAAGADWAEVDVQLTADGELVLFHDADLRRVNGDARPISTLTYGEISQLEVGSWFAPRFAGEKVPRLMDAIALVRGQLNLNLELKAYDPTPELAEKLAQRAVQQVQSSGFEQDCILTSFNRDLLQQVKQVAPHLPIGLISDCNPGPPEEWLNLYSLHTNLIRPELVETFHAQGKAVHVWTVNDPQEMTRLIQMGVDSIITDNPRLLRQVLQTHF